MKNYLILLCLSITFTTNAQLIQDTVFQQAVSLKYSLPSELSEARLKKVLVDYNDIVYVLSDKGLYRVLEGQLLKDILYRPLAGKTPLDICLQENTGYMYYLYEDEWLTNAYAGIHYASVPKGKYTHLAVAEDGRVLLVAKASATVYQKDGFQKINLPKGSMVAVKVHQGVFYYCTGRAVFRLNNFTWEKIHEGEGIRDIAFGPTDVYIATRKGYYCLSIRDFRNTLPVQEQLPVNELNTLLVNQHDVWAATPEGAFKLSPEGAFRYFASQRWLDENKVIDLAVDSEGNAYFLTPGGLNKVQYQGQTLAEKATYFQRKIRQKHIRYGLISPLRYQKAGDIRTAQLTDTDNDGLWTAFYMGSQAFRYAVTGEAKAKRYVWEAFEAYERLLSINSLDGFPSRTFERKGYKVSDPERWRNSPEEAWEWKGHTSSDEFVGYIWVAALMDQLIAQTPEEKYRVAQFIDKILMHVLNNDYYFVDIDGKPTTWGRWNPEYINQYPETVVDRKLGSTTLIAGLQLGYHVTGKEIYKREIEKLFKEHGYLDNIRIDVNCIRTTPGVIYDGHNMGAGGWNHSDDEMAFLTYWVLYHYALDGSLKTTYGEVIENHWQIEKPEKNALWNLITYGTAGKMDPEATGWHLREFPMDLIRYDVRNAHRKDLRYLPENFRGQSTEELLPPGERKIHRHNANPFTLDGGSGGTAELAGDEFLLPYWLGRYLEVIDE
ncbi:hypothetical protein AAG747_04275 [Rapidithrix thailandica]|uniref:Uncharacterized protein n=1 Tax=Rapidithrix thailandica TaxID=413964 RepID=A0AAW9RQQ8_9BACT